MTVKLEGFSELEKVLRELPKATGKNALRRTAKGAMEPMAQVARDSAPVGDGSLKDSIKVSTQRTKSAKRENRFNPNTGIQMAMGPASGDGVLNYATFVEFGTDIAAAQPFMRVAWYNGKDKMLEYIKTNLSIEINKAASRYAKKIAKQTAKAQ